LVDGKVVAYKKAVTQVAYYELLNSGHFAYSDAPAVIKNILKDLVVPGEHQEKRGGDQEHIRHEHANPIEINEEIQ
jgi:hypothetical protein